MHKKLYFWLAVGWTLVIAFLCLENSGNLPKVDIKDVDKPVHATFHFIFTTLWFLYFQHINKTKGLLIDLRKAFFLSLIYGIVIEISQKLFTTTRQADIKDVLSNLTGSLIAVLILFVYFKYIKRKVE